jgi:hypothetical protein
VVAVAAVWEEIVAREVAAERAATARETTMTRGTSTSTAGDDGSERTSDKPAAGGEDAPTKSTLGHRLLLLLLL